MAKLAKSVEHKNSLDKVNGEAVVSSSSGFLSGDEDGIVAAKGRGRTRKTKNEEITKMDSVPIKKVARQAKKASTSKGRKKLPVEEEEEPVVAVVLTVEPQVEKKRAVAKNRTKKATEDETTIANGNVEVATVAASAKRGKKIVAAKVDEVIENNNGTALTKGRGRGKKAAAVAEADVEELSTAPTVEEEPKSNNKKQRKTARVVPKAEEKQTVKETKKKSIKSKTEEEPIETNTDEQAMLDKKKTKSSGKVKKQDVKEIPIASPEKSAEKPVNPRAATKRKAANKEAVADNSIEKYLEEVKAEVETVEDEDKAIAKKKSKKEPKEKPPKEIRPRGRAAKALEKSAEEEQEIGVVEEKIGTGRKRAAVPAGKDDINGAKPAKAKKTDGPLMNSTVTKYNKEDFILPTDEDGSERYNLKISSWNVAGLRSWLKKDGLRFLKYELPDIFCLQEIKCTTDQMPDEVARIPGYHPYWLCMPGGYAGVAIYSKIMPINVEYGIGNEEFDAVGRMITAEYEKFFLINVYVPNSGRKLVNLEARMRWEKLFQEYAKRLDAKKPLVICGDMNVSHQAIDLANPKSNTRSAGFTQEERDKMTELLALGFVDTFRHLYPDRTAAYTYWTYMSNARSRNVGWRLDYYIVSQRFTKRVVDNCIRSQVMGSDHCPITLFLKM
ncbi:unnamed protein product [Ceratitis capitata]|uniref:DNA-(apurinic or apyrimidinic site) endonuclease n=1 Tax=Ceratitis capitata TaxID=7213 RepID=A0A811V974_CERCA|nr:unnamed protein product [Ceratitis capitata]